MIRRFLGPSAGLLVLAAGLAAAQEPVLRQTPRAGAIVAAKGGEELQFTRDANWRPAIVRQDVVGGDTLRTGEIGTLGITFNDQTTIRVGRQSTLVVNQVAGGAGETELTVPAGNVWARASRGGNSVTVRTPAASAAIRGTDWSLSVQGDRTSLIVLEGVVEFSNPQGSVTVRQGEGASARIGERPTKIIVVRPEDREQMLFYIELRGLFQGLPTSPLAGSARRAEQLRLAAVPVAARGAADWVAIAEAGYGFERRELVLDAVARARRLLGQEPAFVPGPDEDWTAGRRSGGQAALGARLDLVEAMLAGSAKRYALSAQLFARAMRGLSGRQLVTARCGRYAAATLADPKTVRPMPAVGGPDQNVCAGFVIGFAKGLPEAETILKRTAGTAPGHLLSSLLSAQVSLLLNRRDEMRQTVERMRATDADAPETLLASGYLRASIDSDIDGAIADLERGVALAPGHAGMWNALGLAHGARDASLEAEAAFRKSMAQDPHDPVPLANLAILLLDQNRVEAAGALVEKALALDPSFSAGYTAKGRYFLQKGDMPKAMEFLLAGSAANPADAQSLAALAIAHYQNDDLEVSRQALDNADRLDPNDPIISTVRTAIAVDSLEADAALVNARETVRRYRNRGGYFANIATTRSGGSYLGQAYRLLGLEEWGRYSTDRVADAFTATSFFDQAAARRPGPLFRRPTLSQLAGTDFSDIAGSLAIQGLLLDPLAVSGRVGRIDLFRRPFIDVEFGGSLVRRNGRNGILDDVSVQAYSNEPVPTAIALGASRERTADRRGLPGGENSHSASAFVGMAPSAADRFLFWGTMGATARDVVAPEILLADRDTDKLKSYELGAGWSHTFAHRNILTGTLFSGRSDQTQTRSALVGALDPVFGTFPSFLGLDRRSAARVDTQAASLYHSLGFGDFTLRYGAEIARGRTVSTRQQRQSLAIPDFDLVERDDTGDASRSRFTATRSFANLFWQPSDRFQIEGGAHLVTSNVDGGNERRSIDPRIGVGLSPLDNHWLRASWRRDAGLPIGFTRAPITTVGLAPDPLPVQLDGRRETTALRWDAEWSPYVFTTVEYQLQKARSLSFTLPETLDSYAVPRGQIETVTATANLWLTHGIGVFGTIGAAEGKTFDASGVEGEFPNLPRRFARAGITFVHPSRIRLSVIENYIGARFDRPDGVRLDPFWTTDVTASYETPDRRLLVSLGLLNAFDQRYDLLAARNGISEAVPGTRRTIAGSVRVRF